MRTTRARITFKSNGGHNSAFIFSSGNGVTWLAAVAMSSSGVSVQKLGDVMFEKTSVDTITMTSNQWAQCVIIPISGTVDIASIQLSLDLIELNNCKFTVAANDSWFGIYLRMPGQSSLGMEVNTNGPSVQFVKDGKPFKTL